MMATRVVAIAIALVMAASVAGAQTLSMSVLSSGGASWNRVDAAARADSSFFPVTRSFTDKVTVDVGVSAYGATGRSSYGMYMKDPTDPVSFAGDRRRVDRMSVPPGVFGNSPYGTLNWFFFSVRPQDRDRVDAPYVPKQLSGDVRTWKMLRKDYRKWLKLQEQTKKQIEKRRESIKPTMGTGKSDRSSLDPALPLRKQYRLNTMESELYRKFMDSFVLVPVSNGLKLGTHKPCGCDCECDPCDWICCWLCGSVYYYHDVSYERISPKVLIELLKH